MQVESVGSGGPVRLRRRREARGARATMMVRVLIASTLALGVAGCGGVGGGASDTSKLTIGVSAAPVSLDPAKDAYGPQSFVRYLAFDPILKINPTDGSYGPGLAETFGYIGENNRAYEFTVRPDAKFADGSAVDAEAVKEWFEYFAKAGGPFAARLPLESVEVIDDRTVRLNLTESTPTVELYLASTNWAFVSQVDGNRLSTETLGAGPYKLVPSESVEGDHYTFEPNENYYDPSTQHYESVVVKVIPSPSTMLSAVRSGEIDVALGDASTATAAESSGVNVLHAPQGWSGLEIYDRGGSISPLGDVRVRQALNYAVDRPTITKALMGKYAEPTSAWLPFDGQVPELDSYYEYNPEKAKQLLTEAGYANGLTLKIPAQSWQGNMGEPLAQAMAADLQKVGVDVEITTPSSSGDFYHQLTTGDWAAAQLALGSAPTYAFAVNRWLSDSGLNMFKQNDPELTKLIEDGAAAKPEDGEKYWEAISRHVVEEAYMVPVFTMPLLLYVADDVAGFTDENVTMFLPYSPAVLDAKPS